MGVFNAADKQQAPADLTAAAIDGVLSIPVDVRCRWSRQRRPTTASTQPPEPASCWRSRTEPLEVLVADAAFERGAECADLVGQQDGECDGMPEPLERGLVRRRPGAA